MAITGSWGIAPTHNVDMHIHSKVADSQKDHFAAYPSTIMCRTHMPLTNDTHPSTKIKHHSNVGNDTTENRGTQWEGLI